MKTNRYAIIFSFLFFFLLSGRSQVLNVTSVTQEQDQWCWAGVSGCVLQYYCTPTSQCNIAEYTRTVATWHNFGTTNCCVNASLGCNYWNYNWGYPGSIQDILIHFAGIQNSGTVVLLQQDITTEITNNRPFIIRWGWTTGGGHFVVGHGLSGSSLYYMDPWFGEGLKIADYNWVVSGSDHTWTHTNKITTSSPRPYPAGTISGPSTLSQGQSNVGYSVATITNATTYAWTVTPSNAGSFTSNTASTSLNLNGTFTGNAVITVEGQSSCGSGAISAEFGITVSPCSAPSQPGPISGTTLVCQGSTNTYSISPVTGATSYTWNLPSGWSGSSTTTSINATSGPGSGAITVTANNSCGSSSAQSTNINVTTSLPVSVSISASANPVCAGTPVTYIAVPINGGTTPTFEWRMNGTILGTNAPSFTYTPVNNDVITCILASDVSCATGNPASSNAINMIVNPIPPAPIISLNQNTLTSSISEGNQWYLQSVPILGATNSTHIIVESGVYWDVVTASGCSSAESNHIEFLVGIEDHQPLEFSLYPIPNDGRFMVTIASSSREIFTISIFNNIGIRIFEIGNIVVNGTLDKVIDIKPVASGIYSVILQNGKSRVEKRILISK